MATDPPTLTNPAAAEAAAAKVEDEFRALLQMTGEGGPVFDAIFKDIDAIMARVDKRIADSRAALGEIKQNRVRRAA
jgi:hypothetical protein